VCARSSAGSLGKFSLIEKQLFLSLQRHRYILCCLSLTPQSPRRNNHATLFGFSREMIFFVPARLREILECNIFPDSPFNVSTRSVTFAVIGCVPTHPAPSMKTAGVPAVATFCVLSRRH
jgi:hypothetical protein